MIAKVSQVMDVPRDEKGRIFAFSCAAGFPFYAYCYLTNDILIFSMYRRELH